MIATGWISIYSVRDLEHGFWLAGVGAKAERSSRAGADRSGKPAEFMAK